MVDVRLETIFAEPLPLDRLRTVRGLEGMELLRRGSRLSVQPVTPGEFAIVLRLAKGEGSTKRAKPVAPTAVAFRKMTDRKKSTAGKAKQARRSAQAR
jgi:hypothetical protein